MKRIVNRLILLVMTLGALAPSTVLAQVLAFPGAEGFGRYAKGARTNLSSASVYHVTNLNDSGAGSFRDAVSQPNRFVVFDVGGIVNVDKDSSQIVVQDNVTIAGQTAPGGISIYGNKVSYSGANNTITRYLAIRKGNAGYREDASGAANGVNMMFDHVSVTWGVDETFSLNWDKKGSGLDNITIQDSIIAQGQDRLGHSAGGLMTLPEGSKFSIIRSLFADNVTRNPKVRGENEFINNVVYGWDNAGYIMGDTVNMDSHANAIGNYFIESTVDGGGPFNSGTANFHIYGQDNWVDTNRNGVLDGSLVTSYPGADVVATPFAFPTSASMSAQDAVQYVMENAGLSIIRDAVDTRLMDEVASYGTLGGIIQRETDLFPGYGSDPVYLNPRARFTDADNDGIADNWEAAHGLSSASSSDWKNLSGAGYTWLEEYVNELGAQGETILSAGGDWSNTTTWSGALPTLADDAVVVGSLTQTTGHAFARRLDVNGGFTMSGGTLDVFDMARMVHGDATISGGTATFGQLLLASAGGRGQGVASLMLESDATLQTGTIASDGGLATFHWNGGTVRATGSPNIEVPTVLASGISTLDTNGFDGTISGQVSGAGTLAKTGGGSLTLTGDNSFAGGINLAGLLKLTHSNAAGTGTINIDASFGKVELANGITVGNDIVTAYNFEILDVPDANATATFAGDITTAGNKQIRLHATGSNSTLNLTGAIDSGSQFFIIKGGNVALKSSGSINSGSAIVGRDGGDAHLTIRDNASFTATNLGMGGGKALPSGRITVRDNATVSIGGSNFDLLSTSSFTSFSELNLDGGTTTVGGFVKSSTGGSQTSEIDFNGGLLRYGGAAANANFLPVLAGVTANVQSGGARIDDGGHTITIAQPLVHDAALATTDGGLTKMGTATLTLTATNTYNGPTTVNGGTLQVSGTTGYGSTTVQSGATLTGGGIVRGTLTMQTGSTLDVGAPGAPLDSANSVLTVGGGLNLNAGSTTRFEIAHPGTSDLLDIAGALSMTDGAILQVVLDGSVSPASLVEGDSWNLLDFASASGAFDQADFLLPTLSSGLGWNTSNLLVDGTLSVVAAGLLGDFNDDGVVNLADYAVWRNNLGAPDSVLPPGSTNDGSGWVDAGDYATWKADFGNTATAATANLAVPEPSAIANCLMVALAIGCCGSRRMGGSAGAVLGRFARCSTGRFTHHRRTTICG